MIRGSAGELYDYMNDINLQYVLLKANRFDELAKSPHFELMLKNHDYVIFKANKSGRTAQELKMAVRAR